ncbi:Helix-turn-helix protein [Caulobacter sp. AP07]|uniref:helix-turn-helix domain-containing protein n=1 Tax=Caulobacter sp. AP07 TaxID=1144304 RepID=UPI00027206AC|nr:helix-turn-helix transcriptional regulator [Caulobacter sp. AP07]EJL34736.1 Helix-turn-helix protein [Caulobacter sp. AP07]
MDRIALKQLGRRIAARREALGWTEDRLLAIEAGEHDPAFTTLCRIARALACPVAALLEGDLAD